MGARTQTAIARKGGATIGILDVEITRDSSKCVFRGIVISDSGRS
jgi:hypothetical protein